MSSSASIAAKPHKIIPPALKSASIWPSAVAATTHPRPQLKKQRSLLVVESTSAIVSAPAPAPCALNSNMPPRKILAKQISVDQVNIGSRTWSNHNFATPFNNNNNNDDPDSNNGNVPGLQVISASQACNNTAISKKRQQVGSQKGQGEYNERLKALKRKDSRINISIFLGGSQCSSSQSTEERDVSGYMSDVEGSAPCTNQIYSGDGPIKTQQPELIKRAAKSNASNRRAQFQAQGADSVNAGNTRQRAASAPLRSQSFDEAAGGAPKPPLKGIRKLRRKKTLKDFQECEEDNALVAEASADKTGVNKKPGRPRSASSTCGEVETLVSLLSPEASDSEKEADREKPEVNAVPCVKSNELIQLPKQRPPLLKKVGKSVSFQDDDLLDEIALSPAKDNLPSSLKRNSVAPFAASRTSRQSRSPTTPLNSLFFKDLHQQQSALTDILFSKNKSATSLEKEKVEIVSTEVSKAAQEGKGDNTMSKLEDPAKIDDGENYPDNVQSVRERECYRLYQKMSNMGLNVSFDTVLRGMLTPTELRVIQKKKDIALARQATIEQAEEEARAIAEYSKK